MSAEVRRARDAAEQAAGRALVESVFLGEQGVRTPPEAPGDLRLVAVDEDLAVVGTCHVSVTGDLGRLGSLVVAPRARRRGLATALLGLAEAEARAQGARRLRLNAQLAARPLYDGAGYLARGDAFLAEGIEHVSMEKALAGA